MRNYFFSERDNTFYINSDLIFPNTKGLPFKEHCKKYDEAFKMTYDERLKKFCPKEIRNEIKKEMKKYPNCKVSEFCNPL